MDEQKKPTEPIAPIKNKEAKNNTIIWIVIVAIALAAAGYFAWNSSTLKSEYNQLAQEKETMKTELQSELDSLMIEHELIKVEYGELSDSLSTKDSLIMANAKEIKDLLNYKWEYRKVKKKLDQLRVVARTYVSQMDSLYTVNTELVEENKEIKAKYHEEKVINKTLKKEKAELSDKIDEASVFKAYNIEAKAIYVKKSGKEKMVTKARRTNIIEACFTLSKNVVVEPGTKDIYVRIARPDNKILTPGVAENYVFTYRGEEIQYSIYAKVEYDNEALPLCLRWMNKYKDVEMQKGTYEITLFANGEEIGSTSLVLR